jgi:hypothetical protein
VTAAAAAVTWFQWWCSGVLLSVLVHLLHRGLTDTLRGRVLLTLGWDCCILGIHFVTEDYRWIFLGHACKIAYMALTQTRNMMKIVQVDAYYALAFFIVVHGGAQLELETFDVLSWERGFHCLTLLYNMIPVLEKRDRGLYVFVLTFVWIIVRVIAFAWASGRNYFYATVVASQVAVAVSLIKLKT